MPSDMKILCMHQIVEGARIPGYTFLRGAEVIPCRDLREEFDLILSGHIHTHQILDFEGRSDGRIRHVCYPGSTERTSFVERDERKGYVIIEIETEGGGESPSISPQFHGIPIRPMVRLEIDNGSDDLPAARHAIVQALAGLPSDAVVQIRMNDPLMGEPELRSLAPAEMNVSVAPIQPRKRYSRR